MSWICVGFSVIKNIIGYMSILLLIGEILRLLYDKIELFIKM